MKYLSILLIFSLLFLAVKCPKPDNTPPPAALPPATQTGANTFGCLLNGQVWLPSQKPSMYGLIDAQYYKGLFILSTSNEQGEISWSYQPIYKPGIYYFKSAPAGGSPGMFYYANNSKCTYYTDDKDSLNYPITITKLDSANRIISGTFNFLFTTQGCDTLRITDGRFDMKYTY